MEKKKKKGRRRRRRRKKKKPSLRYGSLDFCMEIMNFVWDYVYLDHGRDVYGFQT